ncbi:MAG: DUF2256 domain-containing protein [Microbacteriaceae bacterium]
MKNIPILPPVSVGANTNGQANIPAIKLLPKIESRRSEIVVRGEQLTTKNHRRLGDLKLIAKTKNGFTPKTCAKCGREFEWRKKWAKDWQNVRYCSEKCRRS